MTQNVSAIQINNYGDSSVLKYTSISLPPPASNEVQIRHHYSGVNFADIYFRKGLYKLPSLPGILGLEGVGTIEAIGEKCCWLYSWTTSSLCRFTKW